MATSASASLPADFAARALVMTELPAGQLWRRLYLTRYADPLGFGYGSSRFSDPDTTASDRFGVVYFGSTVKVCFVEAILRDRGDGRIGSFPLPIAELEQWTCATIETADNLRLADLRMDNSIRMGIPSGVMRNDNHQLGQLWSRALFGHSEKPDGVIYDTRLNRETNIAVYNRALGKMRALDTSRLLDCKRDLAKILDELDIALV